MQSSYEFAYTFVTIALMASMLVAPIAALAGCQMKIAGEAGEAFEGERVANVATAFLLALLTTLGYSASITAPPAWVSTLCLVAAYSPVLWLAARTSRRARATSPARHDAALA
ncbi:MAG: hypothetical protein E6Q40_14230 [Cupriavidus sp.]|nr:MAG: hypothetical protein E6Q40_14230 [Cupriavidus sp.]